MGTLIHHLLRIASNHPDRIALRCGTESVRYEEFQARILTTAARLRALGVKEGDRVLICGANTPAIPVLYFAVHALGAVAVPVAPDAPESVLVALASDAEVRLAVVEKPVNGLPCPVVAPKIVTAMSGEHEIEPVCHPDGIADLLYTTGTTGRRKGVVLKQANVLAAARNITEFVGSGPDDVEVVPLPLSHSFGLGRLRCMAIAGNTLILEPGVGTGATIVKRILDARATGLALVPAGFDIIRRMTGDTLGAGPRAPALHRDWQCPMSPIPVNGWRPCCHKHECATTTV